MSDEDQLHAGSAPCSCREMKMKRWPGTGCGGCASRGGAMASGSVTEAVAGIAAELAFVCAPHEEVAERESPDSGQ